MPGGKSTTVRLQRYYKVTKTSPEPLRPEDIQVEIAQTSHGSASESDQPNPFALALLWAHYQACQQGSLTKDQPPPWELTNLDGSDEKNAWLGFLKRMITDRQWVDWIRDPEEIKQRALMAFTHLADVSCKQDADQKEDSPTWYM